MARVKGTANLAASLEVLAGAPLDARTKVPLKADLTASGTFPYPYEGMTVYVVEEKKSYTLIGSDPTVSANWQEAGSGSGQTIQVDELPTASADELDKVYQYIGETDTDYTHGFFYECVEGETAGTYEWAQTDTQPEMEVMPSEDMSEVASPMPSVMSRRFKYSTEEQVVGEWIDGKPVYQRTFVKSSDFSADFYFADLSDSNIDTIINGEGWWSRLAGEVVTQYPFGRTETPTYPIYDVNIRYAGDVKKLRVLITSYPIYEITSMRYTIQYTKTTD